MKALFIPLMREHFDNFCSGRKTNEYRRYNSPWTEKNCVVGRDVVLSLGYGKQCRMRGRITKFRTTIRKNRAFKRLFPDWSGRVAVIGITLSTCSPN
jgi:hypothetical protein